VGSKLTTQKSALNTLLVVFIWRTRRDSNSRPLPSEGSGLWQARQVCNILLPKFAVCPGFRVATATDLCGNDLKQARNTQRGFAHSSAKTPPSSIGSSAQMVGRFPCDGEKNPPSAPSALSPEQGSYGRTDPGIECRNWDRRGGAWIVMSRAIENGYGPMAAGCSGQVVINDVNTFADLARAYSIRRALDIGL
jgi:hypothetical protein